MKNKDDDDFEDFDDEEEKEEEEEVKPARKGVPTLPKRFVKETPREDEPDEPEPKPERKSESQFVAVPRAVPIENMLNEIYDSLMRIEQFLAERK